MNEKLTKKAGKKKMFDAVVGNPPYNTPRCTNNQSYDLYPSFIHFAASASTKVAMVTPSRWFARSKAQARNDLRDAMINTYGLCEVVPLDSNAVFGLDIRGGVSYFVLDQDHQGDVRFDGRMIDIKAINDKYGSIILENNELLDRAIGLVAQHGSILNSYKAETTFGILNNNPTVSQGGTPCLFSQTKGGMYQVDTTTVKNLHLKDTWRVVMTAAIGSGNEPPDYLRKFIQCVPPGVITSQSYVFFAFETEQEQKAFFDYITTDIVLQVISQCKITQHCNPSVFRLVPNIRDASLLNPEQAAE